VRDLLVAQLGVLRVQIGGLQAQVDAMAGVLDAMGEPTPSEPPGCLHLETENVGTFGAPQHQCTVCRAMVAA
jgi:hypothetical protein